MFRVGEYVYLLPIIPQKMVTMTMKTIEEKLSEIKFLIM